MRKKAAQIDASEILSSARYDVLDDYAMREEMLERLNKAFLDGVEQLEGRACREGVARDGLKNLHLHFPVEKVELLENYLIETLHDPLYYWSYRVGAEDLGLSHPFYVDYLIVIRIHYPYLVARKGGEVLKAATSVEKKRLAMSAVRDPRLIWHHLIKTIRKRKQVKQHLVTYDPGAYHGDLPTVARSHGPHIDTWYGHSYDGINLWLSIDGVNEDNTIILYPEMFGRPIAYDPKSMYLAPGIDLPRPVKVRFEPGQLLLFNPEMLHGTQVNISDETRVALTTRINPHRPRFNDDAPFNCEHWFSSEDLAKKRFGAPKVFPADKYQGAPSVTPREAQFDPRTRRTEIAEAAPKEGEFRLCASAELGAGEKLAIDGPNLKLMLVRTTDGVKAYDRRCPHLAVDLIDGFHDEAQVFCPGHGIGFALVDGVSKCSAFKLRAYDVTERDGAVILRRRGPPRADLPREQALAD